MNRWVKLHKFKKPQWYDYVVVPSLLALVAVAIWLCAAPGAYWTAFLLFAIAAVWAFFWFIEHGFKRELGLGLSLLVMVFVLAFYWNAAAQQNQGFMGVQNSSPCGQSSCSHAVNQNAQPYNRNGFFPSIYGIAEWNSINIVFCYCPACAWASNNNAATCGYPAINGTHLPDRTQPCQPNAGLATTNPADWPNGGVGDGEGVYPGTGSSLTGNLVLCPGVVPHLNPQGYVGRGCPICAGCLVWQRTQAGFMDPLTDECCPSNTYPPWTSGMCFLCPAPQACPYFGSITIALLVVTCIMAVNWIVEWVI